MDFLTLYIVISAVFIYKYVIITVSDEEAGAWNIYIFIH